jgi:hypothetical protein
MSDKWTDWTCIPGRICGGSGFMRALADENEWLRAELALTTTGLTVVERRRDELKVELARCRATLEWIARESTPRPSWEVIDRIDAALAGAEPQTGAP